MDSRKMDEWKEPIWSATTVYCVYSHNSSTKRYIDTNILQQKFFWKWELNHLLWLKLKKKLKTKTQMKIKRLNASTPDTFSKFIASRVRAGEAGLHENLYCIIFKHNSYTRVAVLNGDRIHVPWLLLHLFNTLEKGLLASQANIALASLQRSMVIWQVFFLTCIH